MKKIVFYFLFPLLTALSVSCVDDKDTSVKLQLSQLPQDAQMFLDNFFSVSEVEEITGFNDPAGGIYLYQVILKNYVSVEFDAVGKWIGMESRDGIPESVSKRLVGNNILEALREKESQAKIIRLEPHFQNTIFIRMDNMHEYGRCNGLQSTVLAERINGNELNKLPGDINKFIDRNNLQAMAEYSGFYKMNEDGVEEENGDIYRLYIYESLTLSFDKNGKWINGDVNLFSDEIKGATEVLENIAAKELPLSLSEAIKGETNLGHICTIAIYGDGNYGFLFKNKSLLINDKTGIITPPVAVSDKIIADYFAEGYFVDKTEGQNMVGPYEYVFQFRYTGEKDNVSFTLDMNGDWTSISAYYVDEDEPKMYTVALPRKLLDDKLPTKAMTYMDEHHKDAKIHSITRQVNGYVASIGDEGVAIYFDKDGNYRTQIQIIKK